MQIQDILLREPQGVLSLTGSGGKTSLMFHLAALLVGSGKSVLTTTTTKILPPTQEQSETLLIEPDPQRVLREASFWRYVTGHVTAAAARQPDPPGKLLGFPPEEIGTFAASGLFDWIIVEADGSGKLPLKAPAGHEPVIPPCTTVLVSVAGLEVLGQPFDERLVFRPELAGPLMGLSAGEIITEASLVRLFSHPEGSFKGAPEAARRFLFLNKADNAERRAGAARIAELLRGIHPPVAEAVLVGQALHGVQLHEVHHLGGGA